MKKMTPELRPELLEEEKLAKAIGGNDPIYVPPGFPDPRSPSPGYPFPGPIDIPPWHPTDGG